MLEDLKNMLKKQQTDEKQDLPIKDLIRFDYGILKDYPSLVIKYIVYESSFGVKEIKKDKPLQKSGSYKIHSNAEKLKSLLKQIQEHSKKSEIAKYKRVRNQSELIHKYRKNNMSTKFINAMKDAMPTEYEIQVKCSFFVGVLPERNTFRIYINDLERVDEFEDQLESFKELALGEILNSKIKQLKSDR